MAERGIDVCTTAYRADARTLTQCLDKRRRRCTTRVQHAMLLQIA
jgi:hypothetical protein